jgi:hypothetical protein
MNRARAYRACLYLYPRRFRREYGAPMVQLFRDQRRERGKRAWMTVARDLLTTLPVQYTEAFMHLNPQGKLVAAAVATTAGIVAFSLVGGAMIALLLMLLLAWILMSLLKERGAVASSGLWWKLLSSGAALFAILFAVFAPPWPRAWREAVPADVAWPVGLFGFVIAMVLMVTGILTGLVQWGAGRRRVAG